MHFTKMQGLGNDYVYLDCLKRTPDKLSELAVKISDRHFGVGSDGLICICPSDKADFRMRMFNADGSEGEMCGNGIRCVAKYAYEHGIVRKSRISIETKSGVRELALTVEDEKVTYVQVNMGRAVLRPSEIPIRAEGESFVAQSLTVAGKNYSATCVSMA